MRAAFARAQQHDGTGRRLRFVACDIDKGAAARLRQSLSDEDEVWAGDFLDLSAEAMPLVDGIIANPLHEKSCLRSAASQSTAREI